MSTPPTRGELPFDGSAHWADPSSPVSIDKAAPVAEQAAPTVPTVQTPPAAEVPFDPYRFGAPDYPVPPEYAPPGYVPPPQAVTPPAVQNPYAYQPPYGQPYQPYAAPPFHQYPQPGRTNGKAIAALVLGLLSIIFFFFSIFDLALIIPGIVFGSLGLGEAKRPGGTGRGMAKAGLVLAVIGAVLMVAFSLWVLPKAARCQNDYPSGSAEYNTCIRDIFQ